MKNVNCEWRGRYFVVESIDDIEAEQKKPGDMACVLSGAPGQRGLYWWDGGKWER